MFSILIVENAKKEKNTFFSKTQQNLLLSSLSNDFITMFSLKDGVF